MKKTFLLASILFVSVISTACINNFAVQELNNKAKDFMNKGDYTSAIERLKSSIDLDDSVFETQYNLAVAYTQAEDYNSAMKTFQKAIELRPDFADSYYSLAVCEENTAKDLISGELVLNETGEIEKSEKTNDDEENVKELNEDTKAKIVEFLKSAKEDYQLYSDKSPADKDEIERKLEELDSLSEKYVK